MDPDEGYTWMVASLYQSGDYSDVKIVCGSNTYRVHKNIICPQSSFFRAACRPDAFKEGKTGIIRIPANEIRNANSQPLTSENFDWDMDVESPEMVDAMINYLYHQDIRFGRQGAGAHFLQDGTLAGYARMYAMGEKYGVVGLKMQAAKHLGLLLGSMEHGILTAITIAFSGTADSDTTLRDVVVEGLHRHMSRWEDVEEIQDKLRDTPDLMYALYKHSRARVLMV